MDAGRKPSRLIRDPARARPCTRVGRQESAAPGIERSRQRGPSSVDRQRLRSHELGRKQFGQDESEREPIARSAIAAARARPELGRHVPRRTSGWRGETRVRRETEIDEARTPHRWVARSAPTLRLDDEDVRRFDVSVGDACGIQLGECFADVACDRDGDRAPMIFGPGDGRIEPLPLHPRRRQVDRPDPRSTVGARKTDGHPSHREQFRQVRRKSARKSLRFGREPSRARVVARDFQGDDPPAGGVSSAPDLARFAAPNPIEGGEPPPRRLPIRQLRWRA